MNKLLLSGLFAVGLTGINSVAGLCAPASPSATGSKPNIVVFLADDHSLLDSSVYGAKDVRTPNMKRLSEAGLTFNNAFVASPSCAPSRAALLTGLMPARNGAEPNQMAPRMDIKKLPAYLHEQGYEVVAIGKVAHYAQVKDYGFDYVSHYNYHDDECVPAAVRWLNGRTSKKPLAFFVGTNWPHVPWPKDGEGYQTNTVNLPPTFVDTPQTRQWRTRYYAAISRFDTDLGKIYDAARAKLGSNTFFLQSSDHGAQWPFGKWNCYDSGIHVPLIVSWPGVVKAGTRTDAMVSWVDILPTLIEATGGKAPKELDGRSFLSVLRDPKKPGRDRIFSTHSGDGNWNVYPMRSVRTERWKYILNLHPEFAYTTHIDRNAISGDGSYWSSWKSAAATSPSARTTVDRYRERPAEELYDLKADPFEQHNLAAQPTLAQTKAELRRELEAWMTAQGDKRTIFGQPHLLTEAEDAPPQIVGKELTITCTVTPDSANASGVVVAQGGNKIGYALYLDAGKPVFVVRQKGQLYTAASTASPTGTFVLEAHLLRDGVMTVAVNGVIVARGQAPGLFGGQPAEGFAIGQDTQFAVGEYQAPNRLKGKVENAKVSVR